MWSLTHGRGSVGREAWSLRCHGQFRDEAMAMRRLVACSARLNAMCCLPVAS